MKPDARSITSVFNIRLGAVRFGSFDLQFCGRNSRGNEASVTVTIPWALFPLFMSYAAMAWLKEKDLREQEIKAIDSFFKKEAA